MAEVAVGGAPDPDWGERVVAWAVPADPDAPPTVEELRAFARARLSALPRQSWSSTAAAQRLGQAGQRELPPAPPARRHAAGPAPGREAWSARPSNIGQYVCR